jgi:endonuclease/exonuclease/phosphatase family metal-dependent hydrolase
MRSVSFRLAHLLLVLGTLAAALRAGQSNATSPAPVPPLTVRAMSFNLRFAATQPPNAWPDRRPVVRQLIEQTAPDIIGTQEGIYAQLRDIATDLPVYDWIGLGREGGNRGEFMAVFFRKDRFEPVAVDHFWLSDTPDRIGSITWGHKYQRMATWVRLRERASGREFYVWNTHLDHEVETAREKAAGLIRDRIAALDPTVPLLLTGDFNCAAGASRAYEILTRDAGLTDTWTMTSTRVNDGLNTFHNYEPPLRDGVRIDWILARGVPTVENVGIVDFHQGDQFPSDHFPVVADVRF